MKIKLTVIITVLLLILTSCSQIATNEAFGTFSIPIKTIKPEIKHNLAKLTTHSSITSKHDAESSMPDPLTDEEIENAYSKAYEAVQWFYGSGPQLDKASAIGDADLRYKYYRVSEPEIENMNNLNEYLSSIFSPEIVTKLMAFSNNKEIFKEIDGVFCRQDKNYSISLYTYDISERPPYIKQLDGSKYAYCIDKTLSKSPELSLMPGDEERTSKSYLFEYELEYIDGSWLFSKFPIIKPFTEEDFDYSNYTGEYEIIDKVDDESTIELAFEKLVDVEVWLNSNSASLSESTLPYKMSVSLGDNYYERIYNHTIKTLDDFNRYLKTIVAEEIVDQYLSHSSFIEIDGDLYAPFLGFTTHTGPDGGFVEKINDKKYIYHARIKSLGEITDTTEEYLIYLHDFSFEYVDNRWVFTNIEYCFKTYPDESPVDREIVNWNAE